MFLLVLYVCHIDIFWLEGVFCKDTSKIGGYIRLCMVLCLLKFCYSRLTLPQLFVIIKKDSTPKYGYFLPSTPTIKRVTELTQKRKPKPKPKQENPHVYRHTNHQHSSPFPPIISRPMGNRPAIHRLFARGKKRMPIKLGIRLHHPMGLI